MESKNIHVEGMMCDHCEQRIMDVVNKIEGVIACRASAKEKRLCVTFDSSMLQDTKIIEAIESIGYEVI